MQGLRPVSILRLISGRADFTQRERQPVPSALCCLDKQGERELIFFFSLFYFIFGVGGNRAANKAGNGFQMS